MCQERKQLICVMWASAGHLCHCQTRQGCFFFHLATLTAQLFSKGGLDIKIHHVSFPLLWRGSRRKSPVSLPVSACHVVRPSHIRWRACVTLQVPVMSWALRARRAEAPRALRLQNNHQVCLICYSNWDTRFPWILSKSRTFHHFAS